MQDIQIELKELECLIVTRPARRIHLLDHTASTPSARAVNAEARWPSAQNGWCVDQDHPPRPIPQWVLRYRRGTPFNPRRAAWWINYDLLCETGRVLPCFEVKLDTLARPYQSRNHRFGTDPSIHSAEGFEAMERQFALNGPMPPTGLRVALWEGM